MSQFPYFRGKTRRSMMFNCFYLFFFCNQVLCCFVKLHWNVFLIFFSKKKKIGGHKSFLWGHWYPCFDFWWLSSGFQSQRGQPYSHLVEVYVLHVPWDSPLVRHLPTSWRLEMYLIERCKVKNTGRSFEFVWVIVPWSHLSWERVADRYRNMFSDSLHHHYVCKHELTREVLMY